MSNRVKVWTRICRSAYSGEAYREAAASRASSLFGYLAVLITIATVIITIQAHLNSVRFLEQSRPWLNQHVPELHITKGTLSSPAPQPYLWAESDFGFVLDTTGATTDLDPKYTRGILLTNTEAIVRRSAMETRRYSFHTMPDIVINQETIARWIAAIKSWLWLAVAIGMFVWLWIAKLLQVLVWSLLGILVNAAAKRALSYRSVWNIGVYALTVPFLFDVLIMTLGLQGALFGLISLALYAAYLIRGMLAQPRAVSDTYS